MNEKGCWEQFGNAMRYAVITEYWIRFGKELVNHQTRYRIQIYLYWCLIVSVLTAKELLNA